MLAGVVDIAVMLNTKLTSSTNLRATYLTRIRWTNREHDTACNSTYHSTNHEDGKVCRSRLHRGAHQRENA
jgi:hypothetical protein